MPTVPSTVKEFSDLVVRSRLMTADELQAASLPTNDLDAFRRALISGKRLTEYQAALLLRGHADGFFLGPYRILDLISKGRLAGVYKAVHESGQIVAIKVLPASKAKDAEVLARFRREAKLLTRLDHPNVVRAFQVAEAGNRNYFVLEYLDGETLEEVLEQSKGLPPVEAVRIVHQALLGLQHIHERGMIHRDLNPGNLMLVGDGTSDRAVKILDIGLGKSVFDETLASPVGDPSQLTSDGVLIGTAEYLAPEQARSARTADIRCDIYSLGCVLYHALTGQPPFPDKSVLNQVMRHATAPPRPLTDFLSSVPDGLQHVVNSMLAKDPAHRYATPLKAAQALNLLLKISPAPRSAPAASPAYQQYLSKEEPVVAAKPEPGTPAIPVGKFQTAGKKADSKTQEPVRPASAVPNIDVELVSVSVPDAAKTKRGDDPKGFFDFNRRDALMATIGGLLVVAAIIAGWGLSKALRRSPPAEPIPEASVPKEG